MGAAADAFAAHVRAWNSRSRADWLALFSDDIELEDPVGGVPKHGRDALVTTWERSQTDDRRWTLHPQRVVEGGDEVAVVLHNHGELPTGSVDITSIEIWRVDRAGTVVSIRTFFDTDPAVHDPYYLPASAG
jgi:ketosteroid isomerase-like protein